MYYYITLISILYYKYIIILKKTEYLIFFFERKLFNYIFLELKFFNFNKKNYLIELIKKKIMKEA